MKSPIHPQIRPIAGLLVLFTALLAGCGAGGDRGGAAPASAAEAQAPMLEVTPGLLLGYSGMAYRMYQAAFDREPDQGGLDFYIDQLRSGRMSLKAMAVGFVNSPEFKSRYGNAVSSAQFVQLLYQNVLGRGPDAAGLQFHQANLDSGRLDFADTLVSFSESPENIARVNTRVGPTFTQMRAAHMYSNYGDNVRAVKPSLTDAPPAITAASVATELFRASYSDNGQTITNDLAVVRMTTVSVGGVTYPSAVFTFGRRTDTGELSLSFRPSQDAALSAFSGFGGDVNLSVSANGARAYQWELVKVKGAARQLIAAVVAGSDALLGASTYSTGAGAGFDKASLIQAMAQFRAGITTDDNAYFNYLRDKNINWLALTVPVFYGDLSDPRVSLKYRPLGNIDSGASFTFDDEDLAHFLAKARKAGFKIMLGLELSPVFMAVTPGEPNCRTINHKPNRWLLGQPTVAASDPMQACIDPALWWWNPSHPDHARNTAIFWQTYTEVAVKYAKMAQAAGVEMYAFATEQDNLVRTRSARAPYDNNFRPQLQSLINAIRADYKGLLTYDQQHQTMSDPGMFGGGTGTAEAFAGVFEDLGLDVVGTSAYFQLTASNPGRVLSVAELESIWQDIFTRHLIPRQAANPGKPLVFTEFGYTDDVGATAIQGSNLGMPEPAATGVVSPGQQQQQNIFQAFFNVNARNNYLIRGAFIWGVSAISDYDCNNIVFGIYCKASAETVKKTYGDWKSVP